MQDANNPNEQSILDAISTSVPDVSKAYHDTFDHLPEEKKNTMALILNLFMFAGNVYSALTSPVGNDTSKMMLAGAYVTQYMTVFRYLKQVFNVDDDLELVKNLQKTSDYLVKKGWNGTPVYTDKNNSTVYTTAYGMHQNMEYIYRNYNSLRKETEHHTDKRKDETDASQHQSDILSMLSKEERLSA